MEASKIIELLGGESNIVKMSNCMTRLRPALKESNVVKWDELKAYPGVLKVLDDYTINPMIVVGPGIAETTCKAINEILSAKQAADDKAKNAGTAIIKKRNAKGFLKLISRVFSPIVPLLAGCGLLFGIYNIVFMIMFKCGMSAEQIGSNLPMAIFKLISSMFFTLLNVAICTQACEIAGGNKFLGMVLGGIIAFTTTFMEKTVYNPVLFTIGDYKFTLLEDGRGGAIAAMTAGFLVGYSDKWLKSKLPDALKIHFPSLISVASVGLITLLVIQPIAGVIMFGISKALNWFFALQIPLGPNYGFHFGYIFIAVPYLALVMLGIHHATKPIEIQYLHDPKFGYSPVSTVTDMGGAGQIGASLGLLLRYGKKNKRLKETATKALPVSCLGIGEPMIYGVTLPLGRSFIWSSLGAGVGAIALGFFPDFGAYSLDCCGFLGVFVDKNPLAYIVSFSFAILGGFLFSFFFGVKKSVLREYEKGGLNKEQLAKLPTYISTPCKGEISKVDNINYGFMLKPKFNKYIPIYSINCPMSGHVIDINKTDKSMIIKSINGVEIKIIAYLNVKALRVIPKVGDEVIEGKPLYRVSNKEIGDGINSAKILVKLNNEYSFKNIINNIKPGFNKAETDVVTVLANYY